MRWDMQRGNRATRLLAAAAAGSLLFAAAACSGGATGTESGKSDVLVFGLSAEPKVLDGAYISDGESLRVTRQIFEGLVTNKAGTTDIVPQLAEKWDTKDSKTWDFTLKQGVKFHDGTDFNADAVCTNFDRWFNWSGLLQGEDISYYWQTIFNGFAKNDNKNLGTSLFKSCTAKDPATVDITITSVTSKFPAALALPAFSMSSPKALKDFDADKAGGTADNVTYPPYAQEHPVGTGPYKFV